MKYFLFYIIFSSNFIPGFSQENRGIRFTDSSWSQLLAMAKSEQKLIFMDAHTTWCGPCKWMDKNVFPDSKVGELYNENFINAYTDMEKGEGIELRKKYEVHAYPTYLFINGDGEIVHKAVGQSTVSEFIQYGLDAISPSRNLQYLQKNYAANSGDHDFVSDYLNALKQAYEADAANKIALQYLQKQKTNLLKQKENWLFIQKYVIDASSPVFRHLVSHQQQFETLYDKKVVSEKIHSTYLAWPRHYLHYPENSKVVFDKNEFNKFLSQVEKSNYEKKKEIIAKSKLTVFSGLRNWKSYTQTVSQMIKDNIVPMNAIGAEELYSYADMVYRFAKNEPAALSDAVEFAKIISEEIPGINDQNKASYLDMYANLLDESGNKTQAAVVRKTIDQNKLTQAQQSAPFQQMRIIPK